MKNTADFHSKIKVCISKVTVSEKIHHFQHMEVSAPRSVLVAHPPQAHTFFTTGFGAAMPSKQAPRPCRRCRAGVQRRQTASSSRLQGDVPKANQQEIPSFLLPALSFFFSILIVHLFRGFRRLRNTNPNCSSAFVSFHILVLVYC